MDVTELRCKGCRTLLAMDHECGLTIRRGKLLATVPLALTVSIVCYRCACMNVFVLAAGRAKSIPPPHR